MKILAPAKINLLLEITGKRKNGYHTLNTILQAVSLFDEIDISPVKSGEIDFTCRWDGPAPAADENICVLAAQRLKEYLGEKKGAKIRLVKKIPVGAGLGGGSSDAAAVLQGLLKFWKRRIDKKDLVKIASQLGSDVPFFLFGGCCFAHGTGEKLIPLKMPWDKKHLNIVLVKPGFSKSTGEIYKAFDKINAPEVLANHANIRKIMRERCASFKEISFSNSLESVVFNKYPELAGIKARIKELGASASLMSGSGTALFGIFDSEPAAKRAVMEFRKNDTSAWLVHSFGGGILWKSLT